MDQIEKSRIIPVEKFRSSDGPILDVRSPIEFERGNIPGASNFPLFTNEERSEIGTCYKKRGRDDAIQLGFSIVNPILEDFIRRAVEIAPDKKARIHCSRGGMRSRSVAWLLETAGFRVGLLDGGYKSYRRWIREIVNTPRSINILGGLTGTGKTRILKALSEQRQQVLDLEGLANHRGSSFGGLGMSPQPSTQQFENVIAEELVVQDPNCPVWIEAESARIGSCVIPEELFRQMKSAPAIRVTRPVEMRLDILTEMYGNTARGDLIEATKRISKKLGGERTTAAIDLIGKNEIREACRIILGYYDRCYSSDIHRRKMPARKLDIGRLTANDAAMLLIKESSTLISSYATLG